MPTPRQRVRLAIELGTGPKLELIPRESRVVIGSSPQADLVLEHDSVSPFHCEITWEHDSYVLRDLGSQAGTWLSGLRIREVYLPYDSQIGVGDASVSFSLVSGIDLVPQGDAGRFGGLIGQSHAMRSVFERLSRIAARDTCLLLEGESGTGKDSAARAVHEAGTRAAGPFVVFECASTPAERQETELFGSYGMAAMDGRTPEVGAFVQAHHGTLYLDQIDALDRDLQPRLLSVLERREVKPLGAERPIPVDVRVIAASSRDLSREVSRTAFRDDLYYRLAAARVRMPALRERSRDVPLLARHFLEEHARRDGQGYSLPQAALEQLALRPWPGNVRELKNAVEQMVAFGIEPLRPEVTNARAPNACTPFKTAKARLLESFEREYLVSILADHSGNISAAANAAELDRVHFLRLLDRYELRKSRSRPG